MLVASSSASRKCPSPFRPLSPKNEGSLEVRSHLTLDAREPSPSAESETSVKSRPYSSSLGACFAHLPKSASASDHCMATLRPTTGPNEKPRQRRLRSSGRSSRPSSDKSVRHNQARSDNALGRIRRFGRGRRWRSGCSPMAVKRSMIMSARPRVLQNSSMVIRSFPSASTSGHICSTTHRMRRRFRHTSAGTSLRKHFAMPRTTSSLLSRLLPSMSHSWNQSRLSRASWRSGTLSSSSAAFCSVGGSMGISCIVSLRCCNNPPGPSNWAKPRESSGPAPQADHRAGSTASRASQSTGIVASTA
mmetsp:Transcript_2437/g.6049  ORF Transcript_2437/g.6049 Transcript_2437/m.6049 type:complete len:304 (-) Transcript_2437:593-1504(-)